MSRPSEYVSFKVLYGNPVEAFTHIDAESDYPVEPKKDARSLEYVKPRNFKIEQIIRSIGKLSLNPGEFAVIGGANLVLRNIKTSTPDIDLLVSESAFDILRSKKGATLVSPPREAQERGATNKTVHLNPNMGIPTSAFMYLSGDGYYPMYFDAIRATGEIVKDIPLASIEEVIASKQALARRKDLYDLEKIAAALDIDIDIPRASSAVEPDYF